MDTLTDIDLRRRRILLSMLASGALASLPGCSSNARVVRALPRPRMMPQSTSIFQYAGSFSVNGKASDISSRVGPGDTIETNDSTEVVFVVAKDAFLLRANSRLIINRHTIGGHYELQQGKLLSVFATRQTEIRTPSAVISIRGTGVYLESNAALTYLCTCYGETDIATSDNPAINEAITSKHHDAPRYVLANTNARERIIPAPFINHDDQELQLIETLVGRSTPYVVPKGVNRTRKPYL
ncbi:MAG: hypothetical protein ACI9SB_002842 [Candidatus Azotimanducaceae bacterium]|jgi:hypothetical protein